MQLKKTKVFLDSIYEKNINDKKFIVLKFVSDRLWTLKRYIPAEKYDPKSAPVPNKPYELIEIIQPLSS